MAEHPVNCPQCDALLRQVGSRRVCPRCLAEACLSPEAADSSTEGGDSQLDLNWLRRFGLDSPDSAGGSSNRRLGPFGDYEVLEQIGRGGMGVIFKARQASLNRFVAVKMIASGTLASPEAKERFRTEVEAVARLEHPNIVPIHEVGEDQGQPYYTMRLIEGPTLAQELKRQGAMPPPRAAGLLATLARAVHYAHQRGILHRDLKPANVLLDAAGEPHVTDFGLAKLLESDAGLTMSHATFGTPNYMAPEQAAGGSKGATTAADVYSLGAILFEMLTGRMLFGSDSTAEAIRRLMTEEAPSLRSLRPGLSRDLETICLKCLQKEPGRRYGSAEELAEDLERWIREEPIRARRVGLGERTWLWCRRNPALAGLTAALFLTLTVGSAGAFWRIASARELEEEERYFASISLADDYIRRGEIEPAKELLFNKCPDRFRQWEWGRLIYLCHQEMRTIVGSTNLESLWTPWANNVRYLGFDRSGTRIGYLSNGGVARMFAMEDGSLLFERGDASNRVTVLAMNPGRDQFAIGRDDGSVGLWSTADWTEIRVDPGSGPGEGGPVWNLAFSPDGARLAGVVGTNRVHMWDPASGRHLFRLASEAGLHPDVPFTADGRRMILGTVEHTHYDTSDGGMVQSVALPSTNAVYPLVDPNGRIAATYDRDLNVWLWKDSGALKLLGTMNTDAGEIGRYHAFSPDGRWLYTGGDQASARVWELKKGEGRFVIPNRAYRGVFSPDSRLLATLGSDPVVRLWDLRTGRELMVLKGHRDLVEAVAFSPDARLIVSADRSGMVKVWRSDPGRALLERDVSPWGGAVSSVGNHAAFGGMSRKLEIVDKETGGVENTIEPTWQRIYGVAFSPDGRRVATAGSERNVHVWDVGTAAKVFSLVGHTRTVASVSYSPDGLWIGTGGFDRSVRIWEAATGKFVRRFGPMDAAIHRIRFSPDNRMVVVATTDHRVQSWDLSRGRLLYELQAKFEDSSEILFPTDGRHLVTTGGPLRWWDLKTGRLVRETPTREVLTLAHLSPDGRRLVGKNTGWTVGHGQPRLELRDAVSGRVLLDLPGHREPVVFAEFTADGSAVITGAFDDTVRYWEAFPWREAAYPGPAWQTLPQRVKAFAVAYWRERAAKEVSSLLPLDVQPPEVRYRDRRLWPKRDPKAGPESVDLTAHYTGLLTEQFHPHGADWLLDNHLELLPSGLAALGGVQFDVRGVIVLRPEVWPLENGRYLWSEHPVEVRGIELKRKCGKLHFLQASAGDTSLIRKGTRLGHYRLNFADGETRDLEIAYGRDVQDWFRAFYRTLPPVSDAVIAWQGTNSWLDVDPGVARVFLRTYENPRPGIAISTIDFVSAEEQAAPMLIALTVE